MVYACRHQGGKRENCLCLFFPLLGGCGAGTRPPEGSSVAAKSSHTPGKTPTPSHLHPCQVVEALQLGQPDAALVRVLPDLDDWAAAGAAGAGGGRVPAQAAAAHAAPAPVRRAAGAEERALAPLVVGVVGAGAEEVGEEEGAQPGRRRAGGSSSGGGLRVAGEGSRGPAQQRKEGFNTCPWRCSGCTCRVFPVVEATRDSVPAAADAPSGRRRQDSPLRAAASRCALALAIATRALPLTSCKFQEAGCKRLSSSQLELCLELAALVSASLRALTGSPPLPKGCRNNRSAPDRGGRAGGPGSRRPIQCRIV